MSDWVEAIAVCDVQLGESEGLADSLWSFLDSYNEWRSSVS
jgi:hypothetical protein